MRVSVCVENRKEWAVEPLVIILSTAYSWGLNSDGQLGNGTIANTHDPSLLPTLIDR